MSLNEGRLEEIKAAVENFDVGAYHGTDMLADAITEIRGEASELIDEVEELRGRLEAVCDIVSDACAFGENLSALRILEAVRGQ